MKKWRFVVLKACGFLIILTGLAKLYGSTASYAVFSRPDPIFSVSYRSLYVVVGLIEVVVGLLCLTLKSNLPSFLVSWLTVCFCLYRLGLKWIDYAGECSCLGSLPEKLGISPQSVATISGGVLIILLLHTVLFVTELTLKKRNMGALALAEVTKD